MNDQNNTKSPHILSTSSQLLGLCFIVLTALKIQDMREATAIDEITAVAAVLFMASSLFSFLSIRNRKGLGEYHEKIADNIFLAGLIIMFIMTMVISLNILD
jgi:hypothetical protein